MNFDWNLNNAQQLFCESVYHPINYISIYSGEKILSGGICCECCCIRTPPPNYLKFWATRYKKIILFLLLQKITPLSSAFQDSNAFYPSYHFRIKSYTNFSAARYNLVNYRSSVKCHNYELFFPQNIKLPYK